MRGGGAEIERTRVERSQRRADRRDVLGRFLESSGPLRGARPLRIDGSREGRSRDGACAARSGPALQPIAAALFGGAQRPLRAAASSHQGRGQGRFRRCSGRGCADHRAGSRRRRRPAGNADVVQRSDGNVSWLGGEAPHADPRSAAGERLTGGRRPILLVSGFGAHRVLAAKAGLHVFEPSEGATSRVAARVRVDAVPLGQLSAAEERSAIIAILNTAPRANNVVRRYRKQPPLVRDAAGQWRTGRLDLVLGGAFDLLHDVAG